MTKQEILEWLIKIAQAARWSQDTGEEIYLARIENQLFAEFQDAKK